MHDSGTQRPRVAMIFHWLLWQHALEIVERLDENTRKKPLIPTPGDATISGTSRGWCVFGGGPTMLQDDGNFATEEVLVIILERPHDLVPVAIRGFYEVHSVRGERILQRGRALPKVRVGRKMRISFDDVHVRMSNDLAATVE